MKKEYNFDMAQRYINRKSYRQQTKQVNVELGRGIGGQLRKIDKNLNFGSSIKKYI